MEKVRELKLVNRRDIDLSYPTRLPGAVPQPIGLFLFCIEFGWGCSGSGYGYCSLHETSS